MERKLLLLLPLLALSSAESTGTNGDAAQFARAIANVMAFGDTVAPEWRRMSDSHENTKLESNEGLLLQEQQGSRERRETCNVFFDILGNNDLMNAGRELFSSSCK